MEGDGCRRLSTLEYDPSQYGHSLTSPNGIPDPDYSPFHREVFHFLRANGCR
jgi:hypothetical protein